MSLIEIIKEALAGMATNKFRTFLTLLGIIIGVAAVILMVSLGTGSQRVVSGQFESLNKNLMYVTGNYNLPYNKRVRFKFEDVRYIKESTVGVDLVTPLSYFTWNVKYGDNTKRGNIRGVSPELFPLSNVTMRYGRFLNQEDYNNRERVVVIGEEFLDDFLTISDYSTLVGKYLSINKKKFLIIGIMKKSNQTVGFSTRSLVVPITTGTTMWQRDKKEVAHLLINYNNSSSEKDIMSQVEFLLDKKYGRTGDGKKRYRIEGLQGQIGMITTVLKVFTYILGGIAAISLLVGGIGVMNIMLVTVKERTREIGIRMAIGATRKDVQNQFLLEAIITSIIGGTLGILIGVGLSAVTNLIINNFFQGWQGATPLWVIMLSFGFTAFIGIVFGFYPAFKASQLDPIDALRYE